jgi:hypothetical protein
MSRSAQPIDIQQGKFEKNQSLLTGCSNGLLMATTAHRIEATQTHDVSLAISRVASGAGEFALSFWKVFSQMRLMIKSNGTRQLTSH